MTRFELDELIYNTANISETLDDIESNLYSTEEKHVDENEIVLRIYAMKKILDNINDIVRNLDEEWMIENAKSTTR